MRLAPVTGPGSRDRANILGRYGARGGGAGGFDALRGDRFEQRTGDELGAVVHTAVATGLGPSRTLLENGEPAPRLKKLVAERNLEMEVTKEINKDRDDLLVRKSALAHLCLRFGGQSLK